MQTHRVYRDYTVLLVTGVMGLRRYQEMVEGLGFGRVKATAEDKRAVGLIKNLKPDLVITERQLAVFSGLHLLAAARQNEESRLPPFLIIGVADDLKSSDIIKKIEAKPPAKLIAGPLDEESLAQAVADLLDAFVDRKKEEAYTKFDAAKEKAVAEELEAAVELYREGLVFSEEYIDAWLELAGVLVKLKRTKSAEQAYRRALDIDKASLRAFFGLSELYEQRGETGQAVEVLREALNTARQIQAAGQYTARINYYIGEFELRLARHQEAEKAFREAVEDDPENAELRADIGDSYADKGYHAEAEGHYEAALDMKPDMAHVFNRLGITYRKQGKFDQALKHYGKARIHHSKDEHLLFNIARTHFEAGNKPMAKDFLGQALHLVPDLKEARLLLNKLESADSTGEPDSARMGGRSPQGEPEEGKEAS